MAWAFNFWDYDGVYIVAQTPSYGSAVLRLPKMFVFDFDISIWHDDFNWKSSIPKACLH
jgi:hypothetical protein